MSLHITVNGVSKNGRKKLLISYYNSKNADMINIIPKMSDLDGYNNDVFDKFKEYYIVYVNISGSKSNQEINFYREVKHFKPALYVVESFINMLSNINNK